MKKTYTGLEAIKVSFDGATMVTGQSRCWEYVANRVGTDLQCNTNDTGKVGEWVDYNDPNLPLVDQDGC